MRPKPTTDKVEAKRANVRSDSDDPMVAKPSTESDAAIREQLLRDNELPKLLMSITDSENKEPSLAMPSTATEEDIRENVLIAIDAPRWKKSISDKAEPNRETPSTDNVDATRDKHLRDTDAPRRA
jgi:hypothetical protein